MEFVAIMHVVHTPTGHAVVSALTVPKIYLSISHSFEQNKNDSNSATQQYGSDSGMFIQKIWDKGFLA